MSVKKEHDTGDPFSSTETERDRDINVLSTVSLGINAARGMHFILTGSYAVEALTGKKIPHNDLDANIFTVDLVQDLSRAATIINGLAIPGNKLQLIKETEDRLEYNAVSGQNLPKRLEIQFVEVTSVLGEQLMEFNIKDEEVDSVKIPTVLVSLKNSSKKEFIFRVKSLSYAIATWAIRISGSAYGPKRPVSERDLENFKLLLSREYSREDVISVMSHHPQMPKGVSGDLVLKQALETLSNI